MPAGMEGMERYLELFDTLDLSNVQDRRTAVYVLEEFFGGCMTIAGREHLELNIPIHRRNLKSQWGALIGWFESSDDFVLEPEYEEMILTLKKFRDDIAHNHLEDISNSRLNQIRAKADEWNDWLEHQAFQFEQARRHQSKREVIESEIRYTVNWIIHTDGNDKILNELKEDSRDIINQLETLPTRSHISFELVELLMEAMELKAEFLHWEDFMDDFRKDMMEDRRDMHSGPSR